MKKLFVLLLLPMGACFASNDVDPLRLRSINLTPARCNGGLATASVTLEAVGGTPGYVYALDGQLSQDEPTFTDISTGEHLFTITDRAKNFITAVLFVGPSPFSNVWVGQAPFCDDQYNKGIISIATEGGIEPIEQELLGGDTSFTGASGDFAPVEQGRYTVVSTSSDGSPCAPTQITFDLLLPQKSSNELLNYINGKFCNPCKRS